MIENNIVYKARLHWIIFLGPVLMFCGAVFLGLEFMQVRQFAGLIALVALIWGVIVWTTYHFSSLLIKKNQVILCTGFFTRQTTDIPLSKVESIDIRQTLVGSMLCYGSLVITGTGGTRQYVNYLSKPLTCRRYIEQLMHP